MCPGHLGGQRESVGVDALPGVQIHLEGFAEPRRGTDAARGEAVCVCASFFAMSLSPDVVDASDT